MPRRNSRTIAVLLLTAWVSAAGCSSDEKPLSPPPKPAKPIPKTAQGSLPSAGGASAKGAQQQASSSRSSVVKVQEQATSVKRRVSGGPQLDFSARKDPFKPYIVQPVAPSKQASRAAKNLNLLPIQSYDVNKFKLVGIIAGLKQNRALIVDPLRKGYVVKEGMQLGNNNGRITRISTDAVEVLEQFKDDNGILRKRTVRLVLTQKSKETVR